MLARRRRRGNVTKLEGDPIEQIGVDDEWLARQGSGCRTRSLASVLWFARFYFLAIAIT
jgi:hypothetical protein